jgi:hypothetical protein
VEVTFSSIEWDVLNEAMDALELVFKADVLGLAMQDASGLHIVPRPGSGPALFRLFQDVDWAAQRRVAEEMEA